MTNSAENRPLIFERLAAVMQDLKAIDKNQRNEQQRFMFRGIDDVLNGVQPSMARHQVFVTQEIIHRERKDFTSAKGAAGVHCIYHYRFRFWTIDGSFVDTFVDGEGMDYGDKASNKCGSIALKYALINTLLIPTKETEDSDKDSHEVSRYDNPTADAVTTKADHNKSEPVNGKGEPSMGVQRAFVGEKMFLSFKNEFGVDRKTIEGFLGCRLGNISDSDVVRMRDCYMRLKAGEPSDSVFKNALTADLL